MPRAQRAPRRFQRSAKLISDDGTLALIVLALDPNLVSGRGLNTTIAEIRKSMDEHLGGTGLTYQLSGVPTMQLEIRNAVERDRIIYNATTGKADRVGIKINSDGSKVRIFKSSGEVIKVA